MNAAGRPDGTITRGDSEPTVLDLVEGVPGFASEIMTGGAAAFNLETRETVGGVLNMVSIPPEQHQGERWSKNGVLYYFNGSETRLANSIVTNPGKPQSGNLEALPDVIPGQPPFDNSWSKVDESANPKLYHAEIESQDATIKEVILVNNPVL